MSKNIALFLDGTWNKARGGEEAEANTNVCKLYDASEKNTPRQVSRYLEGVGADQKRSRKGLAGAAGLGISRQIQEAYAHLVELYRPGYHLYLFGFSRGAYAARSLAGFIDQVGLLLEDHVKDVPKAFELYKSRANVETSELWPFLRYLTGKRDVEFVPIKVYFIGVWDTVGRLGIPDPLRVTPDRFVRFHRTDLPKNVTHARQALALHELRGTYKPVLWTEHSNAQTLKQVWFAGAHADVGGGYKDSSSLSDISLSWMVDEAEHPDDQMSGGLLVDRALLSLHPDPLGRVHNPLTDAFAVSPARVRSILKRRLVPDAHTGVIAADALRRCWDTGRSPYRAWRQDAKWAWHRVDTLTVQRDLRSRYRDRGSSARTKPWWSSLRSSQIAATVVAALAGCSAGSRLLSAVPMEQSLCVLVLYAGPDAVRALVRSWDVEAIEAMRQLASMTDQAAKKRLAASWDGRVKACEKALEAASKMLPEESRDAYRKAISTTEPASIRQLVHLGVVVQSILRGGPVRPRKGKPTVDGPS